MSQRNDLANQNIWQQNDLDPTTSAIMFIDKKNIESVQKLTEAIADIEKETECSVKMYNLQSEIVWIRVKSLDESKRTMACDLVNEKTGNQCKMVKLPKLPEPVVARIEETNRRVTNSYAKRRTMTRSSTENLLSSINDSNSSLKSSPFSSFLAPLSLTESIKEEDSGIGDVSSDKDSFVKESSNSKSPSGSTTSSSSSSSSTSSKKLVYNLDFLLKRADFPSSKQMPSNWKELNSKYPSVCFCGKVISYFNPNKYYDHWAKVQLQNPDLHDSIWPTMSSSQSNLESGSSSSSAKTDDYLYVNCRPSKPSFSFYKDSKSNGATNGAHGQFAGKFLQSIDNSPKYLSNHHHHHSEHHMFKLNGYNKPRINQPSLTQDKRSMLRGGDKSSLEDEFKQMRLKKNLNRFYQTNNGVYETVNESVAHNEIFLSRKMFK